MKKPAAKPKWSEVKQKMKTWEPPEFLGLVKDLFQLSADNRNFLSARLLSDDTEDGEYIASVAIPYRQRIHDAFYDKGGWPRAKLKLADARKAIRDFGKASTNEFGTMNLMIAYVETGTEFIQLFGGEDDSLIDSLWSVMNEIEAVFRKKSDSEMYERFQERLQELDERARGIGWGYGDHVGDVIAELEDQWSHDS